jgi:hypothetical protein
VDTCQGDGGSPYICKKNNKVGGELNMLGLKKLVNRNFNTPVYKETVSPEKIA